MRRTAAVLLTAALLVAGCGDDDAETATDTTTTSETTVDEGTGDGTTATTAATATPDELPGEPIDLFPHEDAILSVVGVAADDVLNVRAAPGASSEVVDELEPLADDVAATGHNRQLDDGSIWAEVMTADATGWVHTAFLAHVGTTDDVTSRLYPEAGDRPVADTLVQLGEQVARDVSPTAEGEGPELRIVVVDGPAVGDLGEITVDVLDLPDDSVLGERLRIFAEQEGGESFRLRSVESTTLCRRGVTAEGLCV